MIVNSITLDKIITGALEEDIGFFDITTSAIFSQERARGVLTVKSPGVIAGLPVAERVWLTLDNTLHFEAFIQDGEKVEAGEKIALVEGKAAPLLSGERVALNFLQRLSGIATLASAYVEKVKNYKAVIIDTRKTTPGLRMLEKYAVVAGGASNHRLSLDDAVLIKDNHIACCGSIREAVKRTRRFAPVTAAVEVEVQDLKQVKEALEAGADIIMLDNMQPALMKEAVKMIDSRALVEASGGITLENVEQVAATGVDFISVGELTHSPRALDISLSLRML